MVEIDVWRARIGLFSFGAANGVKTKMLAVLHGSKISVSDVLLTYLCLCFLVAFAHCANDTIPSAVLMPFSTTHVPSAYTYDSNVLSKCTMSNEPGDIHIEWPLPTMPASDVSCVLLVTVNGVLALWRVVLSGDVESNPGPDTNNKEREQQDTVSHLENKLENMIAEKMESLQQSLDHKITQVLEAVGRQAEAMQSQADATRNIQRSQEEMKSTIHGFAQDLADLREAVNVNTATVNNVAQRQDQLQTTIDDLQDEIDRLESFSKRNNAKFFGVPETGDRFEDREEIVRQTLSKYLPDVEWGADVIERAHRLGRPDPKRSTPRPIIARFQRWGDLMCLMRSHTARDQMKQDGLRVTQDLTRRQSATLRQLREQGKAGYYAKGKLHVIDHPRTPIDRNQKPQSANTLNTGTTCRGEDVTHSSRSTEYPEYQPIREEGRANDVTDFPALLRQGVETASEPISSKPRTRSAASSERQASLHETWAGKKHVNNTTS